MFLDEPTAALGVVQTANVLDTIRRVRDKGIAVVFISHSMPHVMEVADRVQVLRLGQPGGTYQAKDTSMEELVGCDDRRDSTGAARMSTARRRTPAPGRSADDRRTRVALVEAGCTIQAFQILLVLVVDRAVFATLAPDSFADVGNVRLIVQNVSILAVLGVGMTFVIVTCGHRPVDRLGAGVLRRGRGQGDAGHRRRRLGHRLRRHRRSALDRARAGACSTAC